MKSIAAITLLLAVVSCMPTPEIIEMSDTLPAGMEVLCADVVRIVERFETWTDNNCNGMREGGERPLGGVRISFCFSPIEGNSCTNPPHRGGTASGVTGPDGQLELKYPDLTERGALRIEAPPGYEQCGPGSPDDGVWSIGFAPVE